ncbi:unnamed protein product, partial [Allacma fusca]
MRDTPCLWKAKLDAKQLKKQWLGAKSGITPPKPKMYYTCAECPGSKGELNKQIRLYHEPKTLQYSQCPKVFTTLKLKNRHQKTHE